MVKNRFHNQVPSLGLPKSPKRRRFRIGLVMASYQANTVRREMGIGGPPLGILLFYIRIFQVFFLFREVCWHCCWGKAKHWVTISITLVLVLFFFWGGGVLFTQDVKKSHRQKRMYGENCRYVILIIIPESRDVIST